MKVDELLAGPAEPYIWRDGKAYSYAITKDRRLVIVRVNKIDDQD